MVSKFIKILLTAIIIPVIVACSLFVPADAPNQADLEKDEQAVYSYFVSGGKGSVLILQDTATDISVDDPQQRMEYIKSGLPGLSKETLNSFLERNQQSTQLSPDMDLGVDYTLLSADELAEISRQPNWNKILDDKYPGSHGYTIFSRVGFNSALDQAVIYVGEVGGPLMGSGSYYLMEKENGEWVIKEQIMAWIS